MRRRIVLAGLVVLVACGSPPAPPKVMVDLSVRPRPVTLAGKDLTRPLDASVIEAVRKHPAVVSVTPRVRLAVPATGRGVYDGHELQFEVGAFTDGIPAEAVADEPAIAARFLDRAPGAAADAAVPVIVSPTLLELYNERVAKVRGLPLLDQPMLELVTARRPMTFTIELGRAMGEADHDGTRTIDAAIVGVSGRAQAIGMTVPIGHVRAWNDAAGATGGVGTSLDVRLRDARDVEAFARWLDETHALVAGPATVVVSTPR